MPIKAHRYVKEVYNWLEERDVEVIEAEDEVKDLFKYDIGRIFIRTIILSYLLNVNIFDEMEDILKDKDVEFSKILEEIDRTDLTEE